MVLVGQEWNFSIWITLAIIFGVILSIGLFGSDYSDEGLEPEDPLVIDTD